MNRTRETRAEPRLHSCLSLTSDSSGPVTDSINRDSPEMRVVFCHPWTRACLFSNQSPRRHGEREEACKRRRSHHVEHATRTRRWTGALGTTLRSLPVHNNLQIPQKRSTGPGPQRRCTTWSEGRSYRRNGRGKREMERDEQEKLYYSASDTHATELRITGKTARRRPLSSLSTSSLVDGAHPVPPQRGTRLKTATPQHVSVLSSTWKATRRRPTRSQRKSTTD